MKPWTAPGSPEIPRMRPTGTPAIGFGSSTPFRMMRSRAARSVTSMLPSGRNATVHGNDSAFVTATTRMRWPSAVSYSTAFSGSFLPQRPRGATGMPKPGIISTFC